MTSENNLSSQKVTIMGLGLHGGGLASARYFAARGAQVTVTDLRDEKTLKPVIMQLREFKIEYILGKHRDEDFRKADIVIKNPAVPPDSPFLKLAKRVETDISVFLEKNRRPVIAVTGSKGKSTTVSAIYHVLKEYLPGTRLGGNITVSPLTFIDDCLQPDKSPVILELSSWQLADLKGKGILKPAVSAITNIMPDHQNRYSSMDEYVGDKKLIYGNQTEEDFFVCREDAYGHDFASETKAKVYYVSELGLPPARKGAYLSEGKGYFRDEDEEIQILSEKLNLPGQHNRINLLFAGLILRLYGIPEDVILHGLKAFPGIRHRMELITEKDGVMWFNDSASTIPQATAAAVKGCSGPVRLVAGGTDKALDFNGTIESFKIPVEIYLLEGTATDRLKSLLTEEGIEYRGPYSSLEKALGEVKKDSRPGDSVIFSPGATSFGMFLNEFDRGDKYRDLVVKLTGKQ